MDVRKVESSCRIPLSKKKTDTRRSSVLPSTMAVVFRGPREEPTHERVFVPFGQVLPSNRV